MARPNNMLAAILVPCLLQLMVISCQTIKSNVTSNNVPSANSNFQGNASVNDLNQSNVSNINNSKANLSDVDEINSTVSSIKQNNATISNNDQIDAIVSNSNDSSANSTLELADEGVISEDVIMTGTPVMSYCVNDTSETSSCMMNTLNLTLECANETGASQDDVDIAMRMEIPGSDTGKCLTKCLLKNRGVMTPEGAFSPTATVDYLTEVHKNESLQAEFKKLADYCFGKLKLQPMSSLDTCQFAYDIALCTEEYHKTLFLRNPAMAPPVNAITTP